MKIHKIRFNWTTIVYAVAIVFVLVSLTRLWRSYSTQRWEGYLHHAIQQGLYVNTPTVVDASIAACEQLLQVKPDHVAAQLYLGTLYLKRGNLPAAQSAFQAASALPSATPTERGWALLGAAVSYFNAQPKTQRAAAAAKVEKDFLLPALQATQSKDADILVNLALAEWLKNPNAAAEAERYCRAALDLNLNDPLATPPSLEGSAQLYNLQGLLLCRAGKFDQGVLAFARARALKPAWDLPLNNGRQALLGALLRPELPAAARRELLHQAECDMAQSDPSTRLGAANVLGLGYGLFDTPADYKVARNWFVQAKNIDPKDPRAYVNLAALTERRIQGLAAACSTPVPGIIGERETPNPWITRPESPPTPEDRSRLTEIQALLHDQAEFGKTYLEQTAGAAPERLKALLRQVNYARRLNYLHDPAYSASQVLELAKALAAADPKNGSSLFTLGMVYLERGEIGLASQSFEQASAAGLKTPELDRLLAGLARSVELVEARPNDKRRGRGARPVICATLKIGPGLGAFKANLAIDTSPKAAVCLGSQVLCVAGDAEMVDGPHTANLSVTDAGGKQWPLPSFSFNPHTQPPAWTVSPDAGTVPVKVLWKIALSSPLGVELRSLNVTLKSMPGTSTLAFNRELIKDGRYRISLPEARPPITPQSPLGETFTVGPDLPLGRGQYELRISVEDIHGNTLSAAKVYEVKTP